MNAKTYAPPFPHVRIVWLDACMYHGWRPLSEALTKKLEPIETTGYLIAEDAKLLRVVQSYGQEDSRNELQVDAVLLIPRGWVQRITRTSGRRR